MQKKRLQPWQSGYLRIFCISLLLNLYRQRYEFSTKEWAELEDILRRLKQREPLQYILQEASFCGRSFHVEQGVLIPRPETEELVEWIVSDYRKAGQVRILDIGTGSGCIPVSLAQLLPEAQVSSCDVSTEALRIAAMNVKRYGDKVTLFCADILKEELPECQVDVLVSNPPYITESERTDMEANVLDWEPELALFVPDSDPLRFYRRIARKGLDCFRKKEHCILKSTVLTGLRLCGCWRSLDTARLNYGKTCRETTG